MKKILISKIIENKQFYKEKRVKIFCFIQNIRRQGGIIFLILRDISGTIQGVTTKENLKTFDLIKNLNLESVVSIIGKVRLEKQAPNEVEIAIEKIEVLSLADAGLPIQVFRKGSSQPDLQKRLDWRWLDLRRPENILIFKVWTYMENCFRNYLIDRSFIQIHSPKLMSAPSESGAELFEIKYFDRKAYLAQSPQFYKQMAMAAGFEKVFEIGPVFRANPSFTSRHDTEFTSYDIEISYINSHQDLIKLEEKIIQHLLKKIKKKYGEEIKKIYHREIIIPKIPFPQITMKEAKKILSQMGVKGEKEGDLSPEEERKLCEYIKSKEKHEFVFVTEYPVEVRPFYHMRLEKNKNLTKSFDLLWNGLEITTGAQREHRYDILVSQAKEKGLNTKNINFYLNFFKYGCPPHGGFAMGPTRMLMKIFDLKNVREVTYLYRGVNRLEP